MAAVFQDIKLEWRGDEYIITPTMRLMHEIEQRFSLSRVAHRISQGDTPISHVASIVAMMLRSAGCKVTDDEVFAELLTGEPDAIQGVAIAIITAAFPVSAKGNEGNEPAPAKKVAKKRATKK